VYQRRTNHCITFPEESWAIWKGATKIATKLQEELYNLVHGLAAKHVWVDSGWVEKNTEHMVDQEALIQAAAALPIHRILGNETQTWHVRGQSVYETITVR
jgi:hypothetical protein